MVIERWLFFFGSLVVSILVWLLIYKLTKINWNKQKWAIWNIPFFWYRYLYKFKWGRGLLKAYPWIVALILIWFNLMLLLFCIGFLKPIYEDSTGTVLELNEKNGKQYVDYRGQKNVEINRVDLGQECEGKISGNIIDFCKPSLKCISGVCQKNPYR